MSSKLISLWNFKISVVPARYNGYFKSTSFDGEINLIEFNPQISQITQIIMNVRWRLRNLPGLIPRSLPRGRSLVEKKFSQSILFQ